MNWTTAVSPSATGISHAATTRRSSHAASTSTALFTDTSDSRLIGTDETVTRSEASLIGCARSEGSVVPRGAVSTCAVKQRPVLLSQGVRGVLEIVGAQDPATCDAHPVPAACLKL